MKIVQLTNSNGLVLARTDDGAVWTLRQDVVDPSHWEWDRVASIPGCDGTGVTRSWDRGATDGRE